MKSVAKYYQQSGDTVDLIPTISSLLGVPCSLLAAYFICRFGLKHGLYFGSIFTGLGNILTYNLNLNVMKVRNITDNPNSLIINLSHHFRWYVMLL